MKHDVVVIGSGPAGACAAWSLIDSGLKVLMLEKGPERTDEELRSATVFGPSFRSQGRGDELKYVVHDYLMPNHSREARELSYSEPGAEPPLLRDTTSGWMSQLVGGGSVHYGGASYRQREADFLMKTLFGEAAAEFDQGRPQEHQAELRDWPFKLSELEPWYARAEDLIGIAGAPGGLPPLRFNKAASTIQKGLEAANSPILVKPTPMAINSKSHRSRPSCQHSGLCQDYACRFNAKSDMRVTLIREMLDTGQLSIRPNSFAAKLHSKGNRVTHVEVVSTSHKGPSTELLAVDKVVVACETLESNRLLLNSSLGNPDVIGRYLMFHVTGGARSLASQPTTTWDTAPHTAYIDHFYLDAGSESAPFLKTGVLLVSSIGGPLGGVRGRYWGSDLRRYFKEVYPFKMDLSYIGEALPTRFNRVELSKKTDVFGVPGTAVHYQPHPMDLNAGRHASQRAREILKLAGGLTVDDVDPKDSFLKRVLAKSVTAGRLFHATGGCRMGANPKTSVTTSEGRVHGVENLYVADGSVFPTGSGVNPTLTIQANALRIGACAAK